MLQCSTHILLCGFDLVVAKPWSAGSHPEQSWFCGRVETFQTSTKWHNPTVANNTAVGSVQLDTTCQDSLRPCQTSAFLRTIGPKSRNFPYSPPQVTREEGPETPENSLVYVYLFFVLRTIVSDWPGAILRFQSTL